MNPLFFCYGNDAHLRPDVENYAGTTSVYVLGRSNCEQDTWQRIRDRGSEIYKYIMPIARPDNRVSLIDEEIYIGDHTKVPLWPYRDAETGYPTKFCDVRVGSPWVDYLVDYVAGQIKSGRYSGIFFDGFGARLWGQSGWTSWPQGERDEWTAGVVEMARRFDEVRRALNPNFIIVGNNHWDSAPVAEKYVDGVVAENHNPITNLAMHRIMGKSTYAPLGNRRVIAMANTKEYALLWAKVPGVTHVNCNEANIVAGVSKYAYATPPVVGYTNLAKSTDLSGEVARLEQEIALLKSTVAGLQDTVSRTTTERDLAMARIDQILSRLADVQALLDSI